MCRSTVDIHCATAEIRRGKDEEEEEEEERKKKPQDENIIVMATLRSNNLNVCSAAVNDVANRSHLQVKSPRRARV